MSDWIPTLKQITNSVGFDVLLFLVDEALTTGVIRHYSIRALTANTGRSHVQIAKAVRQLHDLQLIHRAAAPRSGTSAKVSLCPQVPFNQMLMSLRLNQRERVAIQLLSSSAQETIDALQRETTVKQRRLTLLQQTLATLLKKDLLHSVLARITPARLAHDVSHYWQETLALLQESGDAGSLDLFRILFHNALEVEVTEALHGVLAAKGTAKSLPRESPVPGAYKGEICEN